MENNNKKQPINDVAEEAKNLSLFACKKAFLEAINDTAERMDAADLKKAKKCNKEKIQERIDE